MTRRSTGRGAAASREETYFYRDGERRELEKAPDVIGISFLRPTQLPESCALTEPDVGSTNLRRLAYLRPPRFGVYRIDFARPVPLGDVLEGRDRAMEALRAVDRTEFVSHGYRADPGAEFNVLVLTDQIVAEVPDLSLARLRELMAARGVRYLRTLDRRQRVVLLRVTAAAGMNALKVANRLVEDGVAASAEPNFVRRLPYRRAGPKRRKRPSDPLFAKQWHLENRGQGGGLAGADLRAPAAWAKTMGSPTVTIAILDDGLDLGHEEFRGKGKLLPGWNFQDGNDDASATSENRHGTACAGLAAAASGNRKGGCGVAPGCRLLPVRTPDEWGEEVGYADSLVWAAEHGADVISCSWGPPDGYWSEDALPLAMSAALRRATEAGRDGRGAVITWAAGNGNEPVDLDGFASDPRVLAVAATDDRDRKASYSDFGKAISVCAPGGDTLLGRQGILTTDLSGRSGYSKDSYTPEFGGTSAAAPLAAGVAALVLSVNPGLTWSEVRTVLEETAERIDADGSFTDARGANHPTRYEQGRSACYGFGRLNAAAAVERAERLLEEGRKARGANARGGKAPDAKARAAKGRGGKAPGAKARSGDASGGKAPEPVGTYFYRAGKRVPLRRVQVAGGPRGRPGGDDAVSSAKQPAREHAPSAAPSPGSTAYVRPDRAGSSLLIPTGQVVVQFAPGVGRRRIVAELASRGARIARSIDYLPNGYVVNAASADRALDLANDLHERDFVVAAEPNWRRRTPAR